MAYLSFYPKVLLILIASFFGVMPIETPESYGNDDLYLESLSMEVPYCIEEISLSHNNEFNSSTYNMSPECVKCFYDYTNCLYPTYDVNLELSSIHASIWDNDGTLFLTANQTSFGMSYSFTPYTPTACRDWLETCMDLFCNPLPLNP